MFKMIAFSSFNFASLRTVKLVAFCSFLHFNYSILKLVIFAFYPTYLRMIAKCSKLIRRFYFIYEMNTGIYLFKFHEKVIYHLITGRK
jgi:hypothetical protein